MIIQNWQDTAAYKHLLEYSGAQWAWEFLRRNPGYQEEWIAFDLVWRALEDKYGKAPNRNFCAWKNDPRAWVLAADDSGGDCRVDEDKVLIECAMGARWGFYKFPPNPLDNDVIEGQRLTWREQQMDDMLLTEPSLQQFDVENGVVVVFELDMPLKDQLDRAKRELQMEQRYRRRQQGMQMRTIGRIADQLILQLRYLDALAAGLSIDAMDFLQEDTAENAIQYRDKGYLKLLQLPAI